MANQFDIRSGQIDRQRALLDALTQRGMQTSPGQMVGNVYVGGGLLQALAGPLSAIISNYGNQSLNKQDLSNGVARQAAMNQELQGLVGGQAPQAQASPAAQIGGSQLPPVEDRSTQLANVNPEGTSSYAAGSQTPINATDNASPLAQALVGQQAQPAVAATPAMPSTPPIPQNPQLGGLQNLISGGLASSFPEVQGIAQKALAAQLSRKPETFSPQMAIGPDGKPMAVLQGNYGSQRPAGYNPATENKVSSGGEVYNPYSVQVGDKLAIRPPSNQSVTVNPTYMQGQEEKQMSKDIADVHKQRYADALKTLDSQQDTQDMMNQIQQLEDLPRISGTGADLALKAARIGAIFGVPMPEKVVNSAQLDSIVKTQLLQFIRQGGRGITNEEGERFLEAHPNITQDPASAKALRVMLQNGSDRAAQRARITINQIEQRYGPDIKDVSGMVPPGLSTQPVIGSGSQTNTSVPAVGQVYKGRPFLGGDPANPASWGPRQ